MPCTTSGNYKRREASPSEAQVMQDTNYVTYKRREASPSEAQAMHDVSYLQTP